MQNNISYIKTTKTNTKQAKPQSQEKQKGKTWQRTDKRQTWN